MRGIQIQTPFTNNTSVELKYCTVIVVKVVCSQNQFPNFFMFKYSKPQRSQELFYLVACAFIRSKSSVQKVCVGFPVSFNPLPSFKTIVHRTVKTNGEPSAGNIVDSKRHLALKSIYISAWKTFSEIYFDKINFLSIEASIWNTLSHLYSIKSVLTWIYIT